MTAPFVLVAKLVTGISDPDSASKAPGDWSVANLVAFHMSAKRELGVQDVYKLLYQGNLGVGHFMGDSSEVLRSIVEESSSMETPAWTEDLVERISLDGEMVRVNLRPCAALHISPELVASLMSASAKEMRPDTVGFIRQWNEFCSLVRSGILGFPADELNRWQDDIRRNGIRSVHHSDRYSRTNHPAYRVLRRKCAEELLRIAGASRRSTG